MNASLLTDECLLRAEPSLVGEAHELLRDFVEKLQSDAAGSLSVQNLLDDVELTLTTKVSLLISGLQMYAPLRSAALTLFPTHSPTGALPPMTDALSALGAACIAFWGQGRDIGLPPCGEFCHYTLFDRFINHDIALDSPLGAVISPSGQGLRSMLQGNGIVREPRVLRALPARIKPSIFSTLASWVDQHSLAGSELGALARDLLGCPHFDGKEIIEIRLDEGLVRNGVLKKPTFADACAYPVFLPSRKQERFGTARNLRDDQQPGGPEVWNSASLRTVAGLRYVGVPADGLDAAWKAIIAPRT